MKVFDRSVVADVLKQGIKQLPLALSGEQVENCWTTCTC